MSKTDKKILFVLILPFIAFIINIICGRVLNQYLYIGFWTFILVLLVLLTGFRKDKSIYKKDTLQQVFIYTFVYLLFIYICGIFVGFLKSLNSYTLINIFKNILPVILELTLVEFVRYQVVSKDANIFNKVFLGIIFVLFDVVLSLYKFDYSVGTDLLRLICTVVIPSISKQALLMYVVKIGGIKPSLLYVMIMELYVYIIPIIPDFGEYMGAIIKVVFPLAILIRLIRLYTKEKVVVVRHFKAKHTIFLTIVLLIVSVNIYLISDMFTYKAYTIGSGSMLPKLKIGDIAILKEVDDNYSQIKKGDILIHHHSERTVIHRVIKIYEKDGHYTYQTKGDNNTEQDAWTVSEKDVIGVYLFKVPYIGYPSVWLSRVINK
jgi:signal peptidase I